MAKSRRSSAASNARASASAAKNKAKAAAGTASGVGGAALGASGVGSKFGEVSWKRPGYIESNAKGDIPWRNSGNTWGKSKWWWLTPLAFLAFLIPAFLYAYDHIEDDIQDAGPQILAQEGIDPTGLTFDATYRNIEVGGTLPAGVTAEQIEETLEENNWDFDGEDVRNVTVTAAAAPAQALGNIDVTVDSDGERIVLAGTVPSTEHEAALVAAAEETGLEVVENITVSGLEPSAEDADGQIGRMGAVIAGLGVGTFAAADLALNDAGPVTGNITLNDAAAESGFNTLVDGESVGVDAPDPVVETSAQNVDVDFDGERIVLNGNVFDEAERASLVDAAAGVVGAENVVDNLEISPLGATVDGTGERVDSLAAAIGTFGGLQSANGTLSDTDLTINGVANDDATRDTTVGALEAAADSGVRPGGEITVPDAPEISLEEEVDLLQAELDALQDEIRENVVFDSNSDVITPTAAGTLDKVAAAMQRFGRPVVDVGGHTDSQGPDDFNIDLSQRRTNSVVAYLADQSVDVSRLRGTGFGEAQPIADNLTEEGRLQNRRVEFIAKANFDD